MESIDGAESLKANASEWKFQARWSELTDEFAESDYKIRHLSPVSQHLTIVLNQIRETQIKSKTVVRYISRSPRVPCVARCIEGCERETLTTNGFNLRFPRAAPHSLYPSGNGARRKVVPYASFARYDLGTFTSGIVHSDYMTGI